MFIKSVLAEEIRRNILGKLKTVIVCKVETEYCPNCYLENGVKVCRITESGECIFHRELGIKNNYESNSSFLKNWRFGD